MRLLTLILYSESEEYIKMYNIMREYYRFLMDRLDMLYLFYCFKDIDEDYKLEDDILYIKGEESYLPGILDKTIKAIDYFKNNNYDYIIRVNISTILNYELLLNLLNKYKFDFCGNVLTVCKNDEKAGLIDNKYFDEVMVGGSCMIFSKSAYKYLLDNNDNIDYTVIDDISISVLLNKKFKPMDLNKFYVLNDTNISTIKLYSLDRTYHKSILYYRNKSCSRDFDIYFMENNIIDLIDNYGNYEFNNSKSIIVYNDDDNNLLNCCKSIRKYYDYPIFIINNEMIDLDIDNCDVINYRYYDLGVISAYNFYYKNKVSDKTLIINSSNNIDKYLNFDLFNKLMPLDAQELYFDKIEQILIKFKFSEELINFVNKFKQISFNKCEIIIKHDILDLIEKRYNFLDVMLNCKLYISYNIRIIDIIVGSIFYKYI